MDLSRRELLAGSAAVAAGWGAHPTKEVMEGIGEKMRGQKFKMHYGPHFGMFRNSAGDDPVDQLKFAAEEGFTAWEDNGMGGRSVAEQERLGKAMHDLNILFGVFVVNMATAWSPTLTTGKKDSLDKFLGECKAAVDVAKRVNAKWMTVVPGMVEPRLHPGFQTANVVDALRRASEIFEPHGLVMVIEPLNFRDHPDLFLTSVPQGYMICKAVKSPACKVLYDMYHAQIEVGNIIPNIDQAWSEVPYFQIGDNPGRNEPTTGEMNYRGIFAHLHKKGFQGVLGMEHGNVMKGKEGERKLIDAYRFSDSF